LSGAAGYAYLIISIMNVVVESKPNCVATLHVELPPERVEKERQSVAREFQKHARVPGYRPGKAPQALVNKRFGEEIREELTNTLLRTAMREAIQEKKLRVLTANVDKIEFGPDQAMRFVATVVTSPEFELPDYANIELEIEAPAVTDEDIEEALKGLAEQHAEFDPVEGRPLEMEDFAVLTYAATVDGKPLLEAYPDAPALLAGKPNWWVRMAPETLAPGFCEALVGMQVGETREFEIELSADFPVAALRGRKLQYTATLHEIRKRVLPPLDNELAGGIEPGSTIDGLRERVKANLVKYAEDQFENRKRAGAVAHLLRELQCELPSHLIRNEMTGILREIVQENQVRGISDDEIRAHQDEIMGAAQQSATERVRGRILLLRIAEKENIEVTEQDMVFHVTQLAARYQIPVQKMVKDLKQRDGIEALREQILAGKALDLIAANVTVRQPTGQHPAA
jgi:trigger factor